MSQLAAFLGISLLVIVTPGPDTALTIRNTLLGGRHFGMGGWAGIRLGPPPPCVLAMLVTWPRTALNAGDLVPPTTLRRTRRHYG